MMVTTVAVALAFDAAGAADAAADAAVAVAAGAVAAAVVMVTWVTSNIAMARMLVVSSRGR